MIYDAVKSAELAVEDPADNFLYRLRDTIDKLEINSDFTITHRDYEPLEVLVHHREHLKKISAADRDRYLTISLKNYLFDIFCGVIEPQEKKLAVGERAKTDADTEPMANYVSKWSKTKFYQRLLQHNQSEGFSDADWMAIAKESDNRWQIRKNGLTLHIEPEKHLVDPPVKLEPGQIVSVKMPPNLVDHDCYIAVGNAGQPSELEHPIVQLYFNVNSEGVLLLLQDLSQQLNSAKLPFNFRIAYDESDFERFDAAVLEFNQADLGQLEPMLANMYQAYQSYFQPKIPFFCKPLAPGLGLAEKPLTNSDSDAENIGQNHCEMIAQVLIESSNQNNNSNEEILNNTIDYLFSQGVELKYLYLNQNSANIYSALV